MINSKKPSFNKESSEDPAVYKKKSEQNVSASDKKRQEALAVLDHKHGIEQKKVIHLVDKWQYVIEKGISLLTYIILSAIFWVFIGTAAYGVIWPFYKDDNMDNLNKVISLSITWVAGFAMNEYRNKQAEKSRKYRDIEDKK